MSFDPHANFAISTAANSPGSAGTALTVASGEGTWFPAVTGSAEEYNLSIWPADETPTPDNAEIIRVTAHAAGTDAFTVTRTQESTSARDIASGDVVAMSITAKTLEDAEVSGAGDMLQSVYDPTGVLDDAFDLANHNGILDAGVFT